MDKRTKKFNFKKLKQERLKRKLSFGKFADELKKYNVLASKTVCWQWEARGHEPSSKYLHAICDIFKKEISFFYN